MTTKTAKGVVEAFTAFVGKYGDEARGLAEALTAIVGGLALTPDERVKVEAFILTLRKASENIAKAKAPTKVTINKKDIEEAVAKALPGVLKTMVDEAVMEAVAAAMAADKVEEETTNSDEN